MPGRYGAFARGVRIVAALSLISAALSPAAAAARQESPRPSSGPPQLLAPEAIERALFESINKERAARSLPTLRLSSSLSEVARKHSEEMARLGRLAHESAGGGSLKERLDQARIATALSAENVVHSTSFDPRLIHGALMDSEGHRENILLPDVDEVGIGVIRAAGGDYYVTEDFLRSVTWFNEADACQTVLRVLDEVRRSRGLRPLAVFDEVSGAARNLARLKSEGRKIPALPRGFGEARIDFYAGVEMEGIAAKIREQALERFGIAGVGVHIAPAPGSPSGVYQVCTILLAADPTLLRDEAAQVRTVFEAVNAVRAEDRLRLFKLDPALGDRASNLDRRRREDRAASGRGGSARRSTRLTSAPDTMTVIAYETSDLARLAPELRARITACNARRIGISVKPGAPGLTVYFAVVVVLAD